jgi:MYXO-CTERM domain-containing protein
MKSVVGRGAVAGVVVMGAGTAMGQNLRLSILSRVGDSGTWSAYTEANRGSVVQVGIFMSGDGVYGLGGATLRLMAMGEEGAGDTAVFAAGTSTGRVGPFNFGAATNAIFANSDGFRIDAASDAANSSTGAGMTFFQRDPASGGASFQILPQGGPGSKVFEFEIVLGASSEVYLVTMGLDQLSRGVASYYTSASSTRPATTGDVALDGARFWVNVPTPGAMAMMGLGLLVAGRRRGR